MNDNSTSSAMPASLLLELAGASAAIPPLALASEHRCLLYQYGEVQKRCSALIAEQARQLESQAGELMRLRGEMIRQQTFYAWLCEPLLPPFAEADAVICQSGCISQGAHWLDDEYCRRKAQPCTLRDVLKSLKAKVVGTEE